MRQDTMMVDVEQRELLLQAVCALAQCVGPPPDRRHALAHIQVEPLDKGGMHLPTTGSQDVLDRFKCAEHHPVFAPNHALTAVLLDDLGVKRCSVASGDS
jgi:hypothetical protein